MSNGAMISALVGSALLNGIPAHIAIYLSFVVYSKRTLPKFLKATKKEKR